MTAFSRPKESHDELLIPLSTISSLIGVTNFLNLESGEIIFDNSLAKKSRIRIQDLGQDKILIIENDIFVTPEMLEELLPIRIHYHSLEMRLEIEQILEIPFLRKYLSNDENDSGFFFDQEHHSSVESQQVKWGASLDQSWTYILKENDFDVNSSLSFPVQKYDANLNFDNSRLEYLNFKRQGPERFQFLFTKVNELSFFDNYIPSNKFIGSGGRGVGVYFNNFKKNPSRIYVSDEEIYDRIEPGWIVELFQNDIFIGRTTTSNTGEYVFKKLNMVYGSNKFTLNFYGPRGEFKTENRFFNVKDIYNKKGKYAFEGFAGKNSFTDRKEIYTKLRTNLGQRLVFENTFISSINPILNKHQEYIDLAINSFFANNTFLLSSLFSFDKGQVFRAGLENSNSVFSFDFDFFYKTSGFQRVDDSGPNQSRSYGGLVNLSFNNFLSKKIKHKLNFTSNDDKNDKSQFVRLLSSTSFGNISLNNEISHQISSPLFSYQQGVRWFFENNIIQNDYKYESDKGISEVGLNFSKNLNGKFDISLGVNGKFIESNTYSYNLGCNFYGKHFTTRLLGQFSDRKADLNIGLNYNLSVNSEKTLLFNSGGIRENAFAKVVLFLDQNRNGIFDGSDNYLPDTILVHKDNQREYKTGSDGAAYVSGLSAYSLQRFSINLDSLSDLSLKPLKANYIFYLRPGALNIFFIPFERFYTLEGSFKKRPPFARLSVELFLEHTNELIETATVFDGSFFFESLKEGHYKIRIKNSNGNLFLERRIEITSESMNLVLD